MAPAPRSTHPRRFRVQLDLPRLSAAFALALACFLSLSPASIVVDAQTQYFVNPKAVYVDSFEGWGTSLAWWPDVLGHMSEDVIDKVTTSLFSPDELNLNIVRYTIGGTTPGASNCGSYRDGGATESFKDGPSLSFDWTRDPRQRRILDIAKRLGADTFEAFSNTPPQWMTISGCSKGNPNGAPLHINFNPVNASAFADYATDVIRHFHENWGVTFAYYAPFNEPQGDDGRGWWVGPNGNQEGCHMDRPTMVAVIRAVAAALQAKNMDYVKITVADETQINTEVASQEFFAAEGVRNLYTKVNTHGYSDNGNRRRDYLHILAQRGGHSLWMDEVGWSSTPVNNMGQGLNVANRIVLDLRDMAPSAWVYWQAMEDLNVWGLVELPFRPDATVDQVVYRSGFYTMKQFSKYIRKGFSIVHITDPDAVAAYDSTQNVLVLVIVNRGTSSRSAIYDLTSFVSLGSISATRTSTSEQNFNIAAPSVDAFRLAYSAPAQSVTTVVIQNAIAALKMNLIQNGNFETGNMAPWSLYFGSNGGVNGDYAWGGRFSGFITTTSSDLSLNQQVAAPYADGTIYHLSARCASSSSGAKLGVKINDEQGPEVAILGNAGYKVYGLSFTANGGDKIDVYMYAENDASDSYIDDVVLL